MIDKSKLRTWVEAHLSYQGDWCLIWPFGRTRDGYGMMFVDGKRIKTHRYICLRTHGEAPAAEYHAAHSCGRGADGCVNPRHIRWKSPSENTHEGDRGITGRPQRKLSPDQVDEIRALTGREHVCDTAQRYGVLEGAIRKIQKGQNWRKDRHDLKIVPEDVVREIRATPWRNRKTSVELAAKFGLRQNVIRRIRHRQSHTWVPDQL